MAQACTGTPAAALEPLDLDALLREAASGGGDRTVVSRAWLRRVYEELIAARAAHEALARVYGGTPL